MIVADTSALIDAWEPARPDSSADERERKAAARLAVERLMSTRVLVASAVTVAELLRRPGSTPRNNASPSLTRMRDKPRRSRSRECRSTTRASTRPATSASRTGSPDGGRRAVAA
jgi:predicted nucleic acid-binding protein